MIASFETSCSTSIIISDKSKLRKTFDIPSIARSLSYQPQLILADEPTGNLDAETEKEIIDILLHLAHRENKCVIIVTHSNQVAKKADLVFEIKKSKASL